jgi:hypothetical protein
LAGFIFQGQRPLAIQVVLNNGDRLTGPIVKSDGKVFIIETEYRSRSDDLAISMEAGLQMHISNECCATTLTLGNTTSLLTG